MVQGILTEVKRNIRQKNRLFLQLGLIGCGILRLTQPHTPTIPHHPPPMEPQCMKKSCESASSQGWLLNNVCTLYIYSVFLRPVHSESNTLTTFLQKLIKIQTKSSVHVLRAKGGQRRIPMACQMTKKRKKINQPGINFIQKQLGWPIFILFNKNRNMLITHPCLNGCFSCHQQVL